MQVLHHLRQLLVSGQKLADRVLDGEAGGAFIQPGHLAAGLLLALVHGNNGLVDLLLQLLAQLAQLVLLFVGELLELRIRDRFAPDDRRQHEPARQADEREAELLDLLGELRKQLLVVSFQLLDDLLTLLDIVFTFESRGDHLLELPDHRRQVVVQGAPATGGHVHGVGVAGILEVVDVDPVIGGG